MSAGPDFPRPLLVVSRCLGFDPVRYNGRIIQDDFVQRLVRFCEPLVVCPEVEIGLGVPRPPIRLVRDGEGRVAVVQPETGRDLTRAMRDFGVRFLEGLSAVDGFVLKARSPSCGLGGVDLHASADGIAPIGKTTGAFASAVTVRFPWAAIEDEGRLGDDPLRARFLTLLFGLARLRAVEAGREQSALADFHARYQLLLLAYQEEGPGELGRLAATAAERPWEETVTRYRERFALALARPARGGARVADHLEREACLEAYPRELGG